MADHQHREQEDHEEEQARQQQEDHEEEQARQQQASQPARNDQHHREQQQEDHEEHQQVRHLLPAVAVLADHQTWTAVAALADQIRQQASQQQAPALTDQAQGLLNLADQIRGLEGHLDQQAGLLDLAGQARELTIQLWQQHVLLADAGQMTRQAATLTTLVYAMADQALGKQHGWQWQQDMLVEAAARLNQTRIRGQERLIQRLADLAMNHDLISEVRSLALDE